MFQNFDILVWYNVGISNTIILAYFAIGIKVLFKHTVQDISVYFIQNVMKNSVFL